MVFNPFARSLVLRVAALTLVLIGLSASLARGGLPATSVLLALIAGLVLVELYRHVARTNAQLTRFLEAARHDDLGRAFLVEQGGPGFEQLGMAMGEIMSHFKTSRQAGEVQLRHLRALTEHLPVPLMSRFPDGRLELHNHAARRLFGRVRVHRIDDLAVFGESFMRGIAALEPGERGLVHFCDDGMTLQLSVVASLIVTDDQFETLISMQDIQSELDQVQVQAWGDLVSVLTHELMNSITPVASLAQSTLDLVDDMAAGLERRADQAAMAALADVRKAVATTSRRSESLIQFVQGYRGVMQLPKPQIQTERLADLLGRVQGLFANQWERLGIELRVGIEPANLELGADADLIEQVLINLLKNAQQALESRPQPRVVLSGRLSDRGRVLLEVADNGPGVPESVMAQIFVPFFTTKREGSGVGLALTRQIMIAHGGSVRVGTSDMGGAVFTLVF